MAVSGDNPIENQEDDVLGRSAVAAVIAEELRTIDASEGYVAAIMGPWGSGKTSLVNLVRQELTKEPALAVLDFNPWMFSGAEQLVDFFFRELSAQLHLRKGTLDSIATEVEAYGDLLTPIGNVLDILGIVPFAGGWIRGARGVAGAVKKFQERRRVSISEQRTKLAKKLRGLDQPIVVVVDDIDRLQTSEIRDIFKLVRLTASFPNVIYLLAFDRMRVEEALTETGIDGRNYLEKIVQIPVDIPAVPETVLITQLGRELEHSLSDIPDLTRFDTDRWPDVLAEILRPVIRNMRDIRRYAASTRGAARTLKGDVELVDVLGLEAVRIFLPDVYTRLIEAQEALTRTSYDTGSDELKEQVSRILTAAGEHKAVAHAVIVRLFPAGQRYVENMQYGPEWPRIWLKARRVAHQDILKLYLERVPSEGLLAFTDAENAFAILSDEQALDAFLRSIRVERLEDVIAALGTYEGDYPPEAVPVATVVLFNLLPNLPERPRSMLTFVDARLVVTRVVLRLLRQLPGPEDVERVVRDVLPRISTLSCRFDLVTLVGYRENAGHKLISAATAEELEIELAEAIRGAAPSQLAKEGELLRLLLWAQDKLPEGEKVLETFNDRELNGKILLAARHEVRSQSMGSRAFKRETRLAWDALITLYESEEVLRRAVEALNEPGTDGALTETAALAQRYLTGWRPKDFTD